MTFEFRTESSQLPNLGLIVLQTDETIEQDFRRLFPHDLVNLYVSRIPSGAEVTRSTLSQMEADLPHSVSLFPSGMKFAAVGYGCTSGASVIGSNRIKTLVRKNKKVANVTDPVRALVTRCAELEIRKLALLSPYIEAVSQSLRAALELEGVSTPVFGSFDEADDATVAQISKGSLRDASIKLAEGSGVDALFISCTNLKTLPLIGELQQALSMPVLSSNLVMAQHMAQLANVKISE